MNRIKDFFYNKNDLIIVLLILVLAAGLIYYHVTEIMAYPEKLHTEAAQTTLTETTQMTEATSVPAEETTDSSSEVDTPENPE